MMCWNSRRRLLLITLLVAAAAVTGTLTARWRSPHQTPNPSALPAALSIDPQYLDFGEVWETDHFQLVLPVRNVTADPVRLVEWRTSCTCLDVKPLAMEFGPNETKRATVLLDIGSKFRMNQTATQHVGVNLAAALGDGKVVEWAVRGMAKSVMKTYPDLVFPPVSELAQPYGAKHADLEFTSPISIESVSTDSLFIMAAIREDATSPQTRRPIELRFAAAIPCGEHRFTLTVEGATQSPQQQVVKRFSGVLRIVPDIQGDPGQVVFPAMAVGGEGEETVALKSLTGRAVHIESVAVDGEGLTAEQVAGEAKLVVKQRSMKVGQLSTRVRVTVRSGERVCDVIIPVSSLWMDPS